jgi:YD repeat-containing protein
MGWTLTAADQTGRIASEESFAGATLPAPLLASGGNTATLGKTSYSYVGSSTTITEPDNGSHMQVTRTSQSDGAGRLAQVTDGTGVTVYSYDALDDLTGVTQGSQTRSFVYDSLGRLGTAANPESGATRYGYDPNGNLITKTDAAGRITCYGTLTGTNCDGSGYDGLNRATMKTYSDGTPAVTYSYDSPCLKGYLCTVASGTSSTSYTYNALGQVTASTQTTDSNAYPFSYGYDLRGDLKSVTYPSGRAVSYGLNGRGLPTSAGNYASGGAYAPQGGITGLTLGNGMVETVGWDAKLRWQSVGAAQGGTQKAAITNTYAANGNAKTQQVAFGAVNYTQTFDYDAVNRVGAASEANGSTTTWSQVYGYDRWGNQAVTSTSFAENLAAATSVGQYDATTNRLAQTSDGVALPAGAYDAAGNLTNHPRMGQFAYDAENRMTAATWAE